MERAARSQRSSCLLLLLCSFILFVSASSASRQQPKPLTSSPARCTAGKYAVQDNSKYINTFAKGSDAIRPKLACLECAVGTYSGVGAFACTSCPAGKHGTQAGQATEAAACSKCEVGKFQSYPGQPKCQKCPPGTHNAQEGNTACSLVPTKSTTCEPGKYGKYILSQYKTAMCLRHPGVADAMHDYIRMHLLRYDAKYWHEQVYLKHPFFATIVLSFCLTLGPGLVVLTAMGLMNRLKLARRNIRGVQVALPLAVKAPLPVIR